MRFAILIDGGHARALAKAKSQDRNYYRPEFIRDVCNQCCAKEMEEAADSRLLRVLYYDAPPFPENIPLPVSGKKQRVHGHDSLLKELATQDYIAVRRGRLKFRGWVAKKRNPRTDEDYRPDFVQKGVDTRIAMDIANLCQWKSIDRIVLLSGDTDMIPVLKHARINGLQTVLLQLPPPAKGLSHNLLAHCDFVRHLQWPELPQSGAADAG